MAESAMSFKRIYEQAAMQKGGEVAMRAMLPRVAEPGELEALGDDRYLSEITRDRVNLPGDLALRF